MTIALPLPLNIPAPSPALALTVSFGVGWAIGTWINDNWVDPWLWGDEEDMGSSKACPGYEARKGKFKKPVNPNKRKGADERQKSGEREKNVGHPDGEEHSRVPKGPRRPR